MTNDYEYELFIACKYNAPVCVEYLIKNHIDKIDINTLTDSFYKNTLLHVACEDGYGDIVKMLLEVPNINVNARDKDNSTPLMICSYSNASDSESIDAIKHLLAHPDIDVNYINSYGHTPLIKSAGLRNEKIVELILEHPNINVNIKDDRGMNALDHATRSGCSYIGRLIKGHKSYLE